MKSFQPSAIRYQLAVALIFTTLVGCSGQPPEPPTEPNTITTIATHEPARALPEVIVPDGSTLTLELALTRDEIGQGLMFRKSLANDRGMLFIFGQSRIPSFWMKNTLIPLDMIFISPEGVVVDVIGNTQPCTKDPCPQYVPKAEALAVLEVAAGVAESHGIEEGVQLEFERVPGFPRETQG